MSERPLHFGHRRFWFTPLLNARRNTVSVSRASVFAVSILTLAIMSTLAIGFARPSRAAIVRQIPFSAALKSPSSGLPVPDNNYTIAFRLYSVETGGVAVYEETQTIGVVNGVVSVNIGSITPIPTSVDFNSTYYLGIQVGSDPEMSPRRKIGSVPAAFNASTVDGKAPGIGANNVLLLDGSGNIAVQGGIGTSSLVTPSATASLLKLGAALVGGSAQGTYIGINAPTGFTGDFLNYQVNGTSMFKIASDGTVTTNSVTTIGGNLNVQGNVLPTTTGTYDLGSSSKRFANAYIDNLVVGSTSTSGTSSDSFSLNDDAAGDENSALNFYRGGVLPSAQLLWNSSTDLFNLNNGLAITGALTTTSTINTATISGGSLTGGTYTNTGLTASGAYTLLAQGGAINLQPSSGLVALNTANANNELRVYENAGTPTNYISLKYDGSGGLLSTNTGNLQIGSSGDVTLSSGVNLKVLGTPPASTTNSLAQFGNAISGGNGAGTYLSANSDAGFTGDFANFLLNGTSKLKIDYSGNITAAGTISASSFSGATTITANGAASTPAQLLSGTWFTGGTSTTTKPQFLIEPSGATTNNWSTSGTGLGINAASGFAGNLVDIQVNGLKRLAFNSSTNSLQFYRSGDGTAGASLTFGNSVNYDLNDYYGNRVQSSASSLALTGTQNVTITTGGAAGASTNRVHITTISDGGIVNLGSSSTSLTAPAIQLSQNTFGIKSVSATANYGQFNLGPAATAFDGATAGFFAGSASGTLLALNAASGFGGNLADFQVAGVNQFRVTAAGALSVASSLTAPILTSTGALAITSAANGNISVTPNGTGDIRLVVSGNASQDVFIGDGGTSNYAKFDTNGSLSFAGAARPYSEMILVAKESTVPAVNGCTLNQTDATNHSYYSNDCDAATDESAFWQFKMPSNYATGTNVQVDVYWEANATTGAAIFDVGYVGVADGEAWDAATITNVAGSAKTTAGTAYLINTSTVTLTAPDITADDLVSLRIQRDANNGSDTLAVDAKVLKLRVKYLVAN